ncbi:MAG: hypothetical protein A4E70_00002 [Syntrophus sp. PtaU1.Bin005]|jgi:hypothetical protein|nr:MAG: hypothetical protein A4E70_00002 [Syntrophus sp. PtaU1.Bin005]
MGRFLAVLLLAGAILGWIPGCGKKADPVPLRMVVPSAVSDLRAERSGQGIELRWSADIPEGRFKILRSEQFPDEDLCEGCPRNYVVIQELNPGDPGQKYEGAGRRYLWTDTDVKVDNSYFYRIVVCNALGYCSEPSGSVALQTMQQGDLKEHE